MLKNVLQIVIDLWLVMENVIKIAELKNVIEILMIAKIKDFVHFYVFQVGKEMGFVTLYAIQKAVIGMMVIAEI